jgi:hypothetical protein
MPADLSCRVSHLFPSQLHWGVLEGILACTVLAKALFYYGAAQLAPADLSC